jgi:hypothetical protein
MNDLLNDPLFQNLSPFERTVILELARCQSFASAAFQVACKASGEKIPPPKEILKIALDDSYHGILETLKNNSQ